VAEHQLRATEHRERPRAALAPRQVDEALSSTSLDRRAAEVDAVFALDHVDVHLPAGALRVGTDQLGRVTPQLQPDVDVVVGPARAPGQLGSLDDQAQGYQRPGSGPPYQLSTRDREIETPPGSTSVPSSACARISSRVNHRASSI